jgi:outer membrane protein assembly factor BamB
MKRSFATWACLLFLAALLPQQIGLGQVQPSEAQTTNPLLGTWSGPLRYLDESKQLYMRLELVKSGTAMIFDIPELKFRNLGRFPVEQEGDEYRADISRFRLGPDKKTLIGAFSSDGHEMPFELKPGEPAPSPTPQPTPGKIGKPVWVFKTGGPIWSSPSVVEGTIYFGSNDGNIYALKADSGNVVWQIKTGGRVMGRPTLDGPYLYVLSDDGLLYKLARKTGKSIWQFDTHGGPVARDLPRADSAVYDYLTSSATVVDGTVYVGSADKRLYAIDAENGNEKWHFETQGIIRSTPAVASGRVFFGSYDHDIYAVDAKTGALQWKHDTLREIVSSPLVSAGTVYIGSRNSDLFALDAATGSVKWKYFYWTSWVESSARIRDGILYVGSSDYQQMFAIDAASGKERWRFDTDGSAWSTPAVTDRQVYIGAVGVTPYFIPHHGGFFAVDRATGKIAWRYPMAPIPGSFTWGVASSPAIDHGLVFFGGLDGTFYALKA